mmetsp:Transcript_35517/g.94518  ORF Transcript_35517/g.94518 Transcript_35517/m.94518 type:complete len:242 (+) Transcript_35517:211-936(+)
MFLNEKHVASNPAVFPMLEDCVGLMKNYPVEDVMFKETFPVHDQSRRAAILLLVLRTSCIDRAKPVISDYVAIFLLNAELEPTRGVAKTAKQHLSCFQLASGCHAEACHSRHTRIPLGDKVHVEKRYGRHWFGHDDRIIKNYHPRLSSRTSKGNVQVIPSKHILVQLSNRILRARNCVYGSIHRHVTYENLRGLLVVDLHSNISQVHFANIGGVGGPSAPIVRQRTLLQQLKKPVLGNVVL